MPSAVSATVCMPSSAEASVRSAIAATDCEFSAICFEVCASSSTVAEVSRDGGGLLGSTARLLVGGGEHLSGQRADVAVDHASLRQNT